MFKISFSAKDRSGQLLIKLTQNRRESLVSCSFAELVDRGESPLYFDELKSIILGHWDKFANSLEMEKAEFEYHMNAINRSRADAHAKEIDDQQFEKWRISIGEIAARLQD